MAPIDGEPRPSLDWLTSHLADYDLKMASGNILLGGTALGLYLVKFEDCVVV
jgi:2-keto-4-pentenoate hydratase